MFEKIMELSVLQFGFRVYLIGAILILIVGFIFEYRVSHLNDEKSLIL